MKILFLVCVVSLFSRMPGAQRSYSCVLCKKRTKPTYRRPVNQLIKKYLSTTFFVNSSTRDVICNKCRRQNYYVAETKHRPSTSSQQQVVLSSSISLSSPPSVKLQILSTAKSYARCFVCKKHGPKLLLYHHLLEFQRLLTTI